MNKDGLLDLKKGELCIILLAVLSIVYIILLAMIVGFFPTGSLSQIIKFTSISIVSIFILLLIIILDILSIIYFWIGFSKLKGEFEYADLGRIGAILTIIFIGWIILGISFYLLGKEIKNDKVKIGGILSIIIVPIIGIFTTTIGAILIYLGLNESIEEAESLK